MSFLLRIAYSVLPSILNRLSSNSEVWENAVTAVRRVFANKLTGVAAVEFFREYMAPELETTKHPTRMTNFLREAALLYVEWKDGKMKL